eukprot:15142589-Ditylum_brightwellii.AAC.1
MPSLTPSVMPSMGPSSMPSTVPSSMPSQTPSSMPSSKPTFLPSLKPSIIPSNKPSTVPSLIPTSEPSSEPSFMPTQMPSSLPSSAPSLMPSLKPSSLPSSEPISMPSLKPSTMPSLVLSFRPSSKPSRLPTSEPSSLPSTTLVPSSVPSTSTPSSDPTSMPSLMPTFLTDFERCKNHLAEADTSSPVGEVNAQEYVKFISLYTRGRVDEVKFGDLPFDLKAEFQHNSKWAENGQLYIPTTGFNAEEEAYLSETCASILDVIHQLFPPTISPSNEPSKLPSSEPNSMPSSNPTSIPSSDPSSAPSLMPTFLTDFDRCKKYLAKADTSSPVGQVDANEYVTFISLYSSGRVDEVKFIDLPFDLEVEFRHSSQFYENGQLYIPTTVDSAEDEAYLSE